MGYYDAGNADLYVRTRYYNAAQGRWLSSDPLKFAGSDLNLFRYVHGNPMSGRIPAVSQELQSRLGITPTLATHSTA